MLGAVVPAVHAAVPDDAATAALMDKASAEGTVLVIVQLTADASRIESVERAQLLDDIQGEVLSRLTAVGGVDPSTVKRFEFAAGMAMEVDAVGLQQLMDDPNVVAIQEDVADEPMLFDSIPLIDADDAWADGYSGQGQTVAILDTGVRKSHPLLDAGKVVSEACYSTNNSIADSLCPGGASSSTDAGSGDDCNPAIRGCGHGTHVAGIAAGRSGASSSGTINGVGRFANVIAIKVFSRFDRNQDCNNNPPCALSYVSDQILGMERVYALRNAYPIASVNMSLGGGKHTSACDSDSRKGIIDLLRSAGIATVIASGNDGWSDAVGAPGCISSAITVGSTTKGDVESSFSNAAPVLDMMAPGSSICSSVVPGQTYQCGNGYGYKSGTSMATPHVAGAWAVMKSKNGTASVSSVESALETTGKAIWTGSTAGYKPRIDLDAAIAKLSPGLNLGLNWDRCEQVYRALGDSATWCYLQSNRTWLRVNDTEGEESLIEATAANHWVGVYVSSISGSAFTVSYLRVYKN
jgi:subtilisin family serine protease